jgi:uncharacterized protein
MEVPMPNVVRQTLVRAIPAIVSLSIPGTAHSQGNSPQTQAPAPPYIAASAVGESRVTPDRALVQVSVESHGESAGAAAADIRAKQERVIEAVKAAGVAPAQIRTIGYRVSPEYAQPDRGKPPRVGGYRAGNTVQVEVRSIDNVGKVIDAALGAGATNIGSVGLYSSNTDSARREAVQNAVMKARREAEAAATAAGGSLGTLIELTIDPGAVPRPIMQQIVATGVAMTGSGGGDMSVAAMATPVEPGESLVIAVVRVRWQYVSPAR